MENLLDSLKSLNTYDFNTKDYSPIVLAYIGDSVFEICVRTFILSKGNFKVSKMHCEKEKLVNAKAQSKMYSVLENSLTQEEICILRRGRNAKSNNRPKSSNVLDYRKATGVEALFGYLFLKKDYNRIIQIFNICLTVI